MPTLYLATNQVLNFPLGHMQVVRQRDDGVIEEIEVQRDEGFIPLNGQWTFTTPVRDHELSTPGENVVNGELAPTDNYGFVEIQIPEVEIDFVWNILLQVQNQMTLAALADPTKFNYDLFYNSNTFVNTILSVVGIDINVVQPGQTQSYAETSTPLSVIGLVNLPPLPGAIHNALNDSIYPNDAIDLFLFSNAGNNTINTGSGDDTIIASTGNDRFDGGLGFDTVDYSQLGVSSIVVAVIGLNEVTVSQRDLNSTNLGTDILTRIEAINGTTQADSFIIDSFLPFTTLTINGGGITGGNSAAGLASGGRTETAPISASNNIGEDTITLSQDLIDAGAQASQWVQYQAAA